MSIAKGHGDLQAGGVIRKLRHASKRIEQLEAALQDSLGMWRAAGFTLESMATSRIKAALSLESETHFNEAQGQGCKCQACGERFKVDLMVPDELWESIKPEGVAEGAGLLCGSCIMRRIEQVSGFDVWRLVNLNRDSQPVLESDGPEALPLMARETAERLDGPSAKIGHLYAMVNGEVYRIADTDEHGLPVVMREPGMDPWAKYVHRSSDWISYYRDLPDRPDTKGFQRIEDYNEREASHD